MCHDVYTRRQKQPDNRSPGAIHVGLIAFVHAQPVRRHNVAATRQRKGNAPLVKERTDEEATVCVVASSSDNTGAASWSRNSAFNLRVFLLYVDSRRHHWHVRTRRVIVAGIFLFAQWKKRHDAEIRKRNWLVQIARIDFSVP